MYVINIKILEGVKKMIEILTVDEIKVQIEELQEKLKVAYILDPKYRCSTCGGLRNVETQYFDLGHAPKIIRGGCPDCLGQGYIIRPEEKDRSRECNG